MMHHHSRGLEDEPDDEGGLLDFIPWYTYIFIAIGVIGACVKNRHSILAGLRSVTGQTQDAVVTTPDLEGAEATHTSPAGESANAPTLTRDGQAIAV
jgi:hypothetical protein